LGAWGALIMSFFGAVFASLTLYWQWHLSTAALALPFVAFAVIGAAASYVIRTPGHGIKPSQKENRAIMWSSIGEGIGLFLAANIVINLHRPDLLLPAMALVVGLHFLPIAFAAGFRPFYVLGLALIAVASSGFIVGEPTGGSLAGFMAAGALWVAAGLAVRRDWLAKSRLHSAAKRPASVCFRPIADASSLLDGRAVEPGALLVLTARDLRQWQPARRTCRHSRGLTKPRIGRRAFWSRRRQKFGLQGRPSAAPSPDLAVTSQYPASRTTSHGRSRTAYGGSLGSSHRSQQVHRRS